MAQAVNSSAEPYNDCKYFYEDEVVRYNAKYDKLEFGLVLENSEYVSSDEGSDSEDVNSEDRKLKHGQILVTWFPKGKEEVLEESRVHLADRSLMPGDIVALKEGAREKRCGYCNKVKTVACVRILGTDQILYNIDSENFHPLRDFDADLAVTLDNWVGMVRLVKLKITLKTQDGSVCIMDDENALRLKNLHEKRPKSSEFTDEYDWYVGQVLGGTLNDFKNALWIAGGVEKVTADLRSKIRHKKQPMVVATVENVEVVSLNVQWQCQAGVGNKVGNEDSASGFEQPKFFIQGEDLKRVKILNVFEPSTLQLGDRNYYNYKSSDLVLTQKEWAKLQLTSLIPEPVKAVGGSSVCGSAQTESDEWESVNSESENAENCGSKKQSGHSNRYSSSDTGKHHGVPTVPTRTLKKRKLHRSKGASGEKVWQQVQAKPGDRLVVETLCTTSWVDVQWQDGTLEKGVSSRELYPVHNLDEKEFFPGDFIVHADDNEASLLHYGIVQRVDSALRIATVHWFRTSVSMDSAKPIALQTTEVSVYELKEHPDFRFRPGSVVVRVADFDESRESNRSSCSAGQVLQNQADGQVQVWWADGVVSLCWPQELYRVGDYDSEPGELWGDQGDVDSRTMDLSDDDSNGSWETESENSFFEGESEDMQRVRSLDLNKAGRILNNMKKAVGALGTMMRRLENISKETPAEHADLASILTTLLALYKKCRFLDRLLGTSFFRDSTFDEILEKIPQQQKSSPEEAAASASATAKAQVAAAMATVAELEAIEEKVKQCSASLRIGYLIEQQLKKMQQYLNEYGAALQERVQSNMGCGAKHVEPKSQQLEDEENDNQEVQSTSSPLNEEAVNDSLVTDEDVPLKQGHFTVIESSPTNHKFRANPSHPVNAQNFQKALRQELKILGSSLPKGIYVKTFEDRMDLFSVMIEGPAKTPYEGGLFFFDFQLPNNYPREPPVCHYWSYCNERLNPNLYEEGRVCISLLGTWSGKGLEVWSPGSNLLQVLVSIQGLILVAEPYYNEAGYERQRGNPQAYENSRLYNERVLVKLLQAMGRVVQRPPDLWKAEVLEFLQTESPKMISRFRLWLSLSEAQEPSEDLKNSLPEFPLLPASKGFCLTLRKALQGYEKTLEDVRLTQSSPNNLNGHASSE